MLKAKQDLPCLTSLVVLSGTYMLFPAPQFSAIAALLPRPSSGPLRASFFMKQTLLILVAIIQAKHLYFHTLVLEHC